MVMSRKEIFLTRLAAVIKAFMRGARARALSALRADVQTHGQTDGWSMKGDLR